MTFLLSLICLKLLTFSLSAMTFQSSLLSYNRTEKYSPAPPAPPAPPDASHSGDPPLILKQGGLESPVQRLISLKKKIKKYVAKKRGGNAIFLVLPLKEIIL